MTEEELRRAYKSIDRKYMDLSQEELDELYLEDCLKLAKQTGKQLDARKRSGYKRAYENK